MTDTTHATSAPSAPTLNGAPRSPEKTSGVSRSHLSRLQRPKATLIRLRSQLKVVRQPPQALDRVPVDKNIALEEYKLLISERRFIMERYMQSLILYPVIVGYTFKELLAAQSSVTAIAFAVFIMVVNSGYLYAVNHFRSMAYHAIRREERIARFLKMQLPHSYMWGYYAGVGAFTTTYVLALCLLVVKLLQFASVLAY
jgi:hypothetical protein